AIGHGGESKRDREAEESHRDAEDRRSAERLQVALVGEQFREIPQADEFGPEAERVLHLEREPHRLRRGPEEEHDGDRDLRREQRVRQPRRAENYALFHPARATYLFAASNLRSTSLPRFTASSIAVLASFLPAKAASSSSSISSRPCTKLPKRRPLELIVGALLVSCFT